MTIHYTASGNELDDVQKRTKIFNYITEIPLEAAFDEIYGFKAFISLRKLLHQICLTFTFMESDKIHICTLP